MSLVKNILKRPRGRPRKVISDEVAAVIVSKSAKQKSFKVFEHNQNKQFTNNEFASNIVKLALLSRIDFSRSFLGILDGKERNTSNSLLALGVPKDSILLVEHSKDVAESHSDNGFCVHNGSLDSFADDKYDDIYTQHGSNWRNYNCLGWYFDTCRTISTEKAGILNVVKKSNISSGSVLAFTFCKRGMSTETYMVERSLFIFDLENLLNTKGLTIQLPLIFDHHYNGYTIFEKSRGMPMNTFMLIVR